MKERGNCFNIVQVFFIKVHFAEIRLDHIDLTREETVSVFRSKKDMIATCRLSQQDVDVCRK